MNLETRLGLKDDESLLMVVRVSTFTLSIPVLIVTLLLLAPFFMMVIMFRMGTYGYVVMGVSWFLGLFIAIRTWVKWWNSLLAITEKRVIYVRQRGFFDRHVTEFPYSRIQQVGYRVRGLAATIYRFGDLTIESAIGDKPLIMRRIPNPSRVQGLIAELQGGGLGSRGDFSDMLQAVSKMDVKQLGLLKAEIDRTIRLLPRD